MPPDLPRLSLHEWSCLRTELVWIYDRPPREQARHATFDHREGNWAWYLRRGSVTLTSPTGTLTARAGQWLFPPAEISRQDFSDDAQLLSVKFVCQWPSGENLFAAPQGLVVEGRKHPRLAQTARRLERLVTKHFPVSHHTYAKQPADWPLFLRFQRAFFEWLDAWFELRLATGSIPARQAGDKRIRLAARMLDEAPLGQSFPKAALLAAAGVSAVQFNRLFRKQFNFTPLQYWERRRLESARLFLETSDLPLKELANRLGFRRDSHFTVWFKRHTRTSPGRYREQNSRT